MYALIQLEKVIRWFYRVYLFVVLQFQASETVLVHEWHHSLSPAAEVVF